MRQSEVGSSDVDPERRRRSLAIGAMASLVLVGLLVTWLVVTGGEALQRGWISMPPRSDVDMALVDEGEQPGELALVSFQEDRPPRVRFVQSVTNHLAVPLTLVAVEPPAGMACGPQLDGVGKAVRLDPRDGADYEVVDSARDLPLRLGSMESAVLVLDLAIGCPDGSPMPDYDTGSYASTEGLRVRIRALGRPRTVHVPTDYRLGWSTAGLDTMSFDPDATIRVVPPRLP